jgi:hypothetical protein
VAALQTAGYYVCDFEHYAKMPRRASGWPDIFAAGAGAAWLIEVKSENDYLRQTQINFFWDIRPFLGPHLRYLLAESVDDFYRLIEGQLGIVTISEKHWKVFEEKRPFDAKM